nr:MAG TPA: hypothetical protein [Caudoviricetes sp.]
MCRKSGSMARPCHTVGSASVSRSDMALRCDLQGVVGQLLHGLRVVLQSVHRDTGICQTQGPVCGVLVNSYLGRHTDDFVGFNDAPRRPGTLPGFLLGTALLAVHGLGGSGGIALFLGGKGIAQFLDHVIDGCHVVFVKPQTVGRACTENLVDAVHGNACLCTCMVAQTDTAAMEMLRLLGAPALHLLVGVLKAVKVVGVHQGKFKFLSTNNHVLAPFLGRVPDLHQLLLLFHGIKNPRSGAERGKMRESSAGGCGGVVELVGARPLHLAAQDRSVT